MIKLVDRSEVASIDKSLESTESVLITKRQWERIKVELHQKPEVNENKAFIARIEEVNFNEGRITFVKKFTHLINFETGNYEIRKYEGPVHDEVKL